MERNVTRMDAYTYRELVAKNPVVFVPVGSIEQHGAHMPLGVDSMLTTTMAELVAEEVDGIVAQTVTTGYKSQQRSGGGNHIVGSFGFDAQTVVGVVRTLVRELHRHGLRRIAVVNGHYENYQFVFEGVDLALRDLPADDQPQVLLLSYWDFVDEQTLAQIYPDGFPGWDVEHGGVLETALMLEHHPDLVHMDRLIDHPAAVLPPYDLLPVDPSLTPEPGTLSSGKDATVEKGRLLTQAAVSGMAAAVQERL